MLQIILFRLDTFPPVKHLHGARLPSTRSGVAGRLLTVYCESAACMCSTACFSCAVSFAAWQELLFSKAFFKDATVRNVAFSLQICLSFRHCRLLVS